MQEALGCLAAWRLHHDQTCSEKAHSMLCYDWSKTSMKSLSGHRNNMMTRKPSAHMIADTCRRQKDRFGCSPPAVCRVMGQGVL